MNIWHHTRPRLVIGAALAIACLCALVTGAAAVNIATGSYQIASVGGTVSIPIVLDSASGGISGYEITVSLSDPSVATITAVEFPGWASLKSSSPLPSGQVVLKAADLSQQVPLGGTGVTLATITVKATASGSTTLTVTPDSSLGVQTRNGDLYAVTTSPGTLTVGTSAPGVPPTPIPTTIPTPGVPTVIPPAPITTISVITPIPTSDGSVPVPTSTPVYVYPVEITTPAIPVTVSPGGASGVITPASINPAAQPTFGVGKRYAIGNPGTYIGSRFSSDGTGANISDSRRVAGPVATLKPGSRAYGITPPAGRFIRWYPAARWAAGIT